MYKGQLQEPVDWKWTGHICNLCKCDQYVDIVMLLETFAKCQYSWFKVFQEFQHKWGLRYYVTLSEHLLISSIGTEQYFSCLGEKQVWNSIELNISIWFGTMVILLEYKALDPGSCGTQIELWDVQYLEYLAIWFQAGCSSEANYKWISMKQVK